LAVQETRNWVSPGKSVSRKQKQKQKQKQKTGFRQLVRSCPASWPEGRTMGQQQIPDFPSNSF
jgi:hypothetical protein